MVMSTFVDLGRPLTRCRGAFLKIYNKRHHPRPILGATAQSSEAEVNTNDLAAFYNF